MNKISSNVTHCVRTSGFREENSDWFPHHHSDCIQSALATHVLSLPRCLLAMPANNQAIPNQGEEMTKRGFKRLCFYQTCRSTLLWTVSLTPEGAWVAHPSCLCSSPPTTYGSCSSLYTEQRKNFSNLFHLKKLLWGQFSKSLSKLLQYCFCFMFSFFSHKACRILALWPGHWKGKSWPLDCQGSPSNLFLTLYLKREE